MFLLNFLVLPIKWALRKWILCVFSKDLPLNIIGKYTFTFSWFLVLLNWKTEAMKPTMAAAEARARGDRRIASWFINALNILTPKNRMATPRGNDAFGKQDNAHSCINVRDFPRQLTLLEYAAEEEDANPTQSLNYWFGQNYYTRRKAPEGSYIM